MLGFYQIGKVRFPVFLQQQLKPKKGNIILLGADDPAIFKDKPSLKDPAEWNKMNDSELDEIDDKLMQQIRYLDKLVDELAKGKAMEKILRK